MRYDEDNPAHPGGFEKRVLARDRETVRRRPPSDVEVCLHGLQWPSAGDAARVKFEVESIETSISPDDLVSSLEKATAVQIPAELSWPEGWPPGRVQPGQVDISAAATTTTVAPSPLLTSTHKLSLFDAHSPPALCAHDKVGITGSDVVCKQGPESGNQLAKNWLQLVQMADRHGQAGLSRLCHGCGLEPSTHGSVSFDVVADWYATIESGTTADPKQLVLRHSVVEQLAPLVTSPAFTAMVTVGPNTLPHDHHIAASEWTVVARWIQLLYRYIAYCYIAYCYIVYCYIAYCYCILLYWILLCCMFGTAVISAQPTVKW
eukprot:SAG31_NODE_3638_length_4034_cov_4.484371_3_plen_319_part_00